MAMVVGRIRRRSTFRDLARPDGRGSSAGVSVAYRRGCPEADAAGAPIVAYAVGRAHGGAVTRNRLRRRLRAVVHSAGPDLPPGAYLVRAQPPVATLGSVELHAAVLTAALGAARGARRSAR